MWKSDLTPMTGGNRKLRNALACCEKLPFSVEINRNVKFTVSPKIHFVEKAITYYESMSLSVNIPVDNRRLSPEAKSGRMNVNEVFEPGKDQRHTS